MGIEAATILKSAGPVLQIGGALMGASTAYNNSKASQLGAELNAQIQRNNAELADWQARDALARGDRNASQSRMKTRQLKGTQRARMAANGVDLGEGSALSILDDTDYFGEIDAGTIKDNAAKEAFALRAQAAGLRIDSANYGARAAMERPGTAALTSLLTSGGKVADRWYSADPARGRRQPETFGEGEY